MRIRIYVHGKTDDHGNVHNHNVPAVGQFRLASACAGCDALYAQTVTS